MSVLDAVQFARDEREKKRLEEEKMRERVSALTKWNKRLDELNWKTYSAFTQLAAASTAYSVDDLCSRFVAVSESLAAFDTAVKTECPNKPHLVFSDNGKWTSHFFAFEMLSDLSYPHLPSDARLLSALILSAKNDPAALREALSAIITDPILKEAMEWVSFIGITKYGLSVETRGIEFQDTNVPERDAIDVEYVSGALFTGSFKRPFIETNHGEGEGENYADTDTRPRANVEKTHASNGENKGGGTSRGRAHRHKAKRRGEAEGQQGC